MDPTANLAMQRALAGQILKTTARVEFEQQAVELAEHVQALDEWISKGGFLPTQWREALA